MPLYLVEGWFPEGLPAFLSNTQIDRIWTEYHETGVTWMQTYVSDDSVRTYCISEAPSPEAVRKGARRVGWPLQKINHVTILQPHQYNSPP